MDLILYLLTGAVSGFLAGLLGIGGGLIIVPALVYALPHAGYGPDVLVQTAIGSSLAVIVFTALSSIRAHHRAGCVEWGVVRAIAPGVCVGALGGAALAGQLSGQTLRVIYLLFLLAAAWQMLLELRPKGSGSPGPWGFAGAGLVIGVFSSLVGIGGGTLSTPFLLWCRRSIHHAVASSAAIGLPIAVAGSVGFVLTGLDRVGLPPGSTGFVAWPAVGAIGAVSVLLAPLGAAVAHRVAQKPLKRVFACLLLVLAVRIAYELAARALG
ncbi:MAG: sulfite exporter TauE/SafE family protein [Burkholderiales bacterium]|nr:sulfite exporter TauE/SafE family protein [Burkholderiales bacterium]